MGSHRVEAPGGRGRTKATGSQRGANLPFKSPETIPMAVSHPPLEPAAPNSGGSPRRSRGSPDKLMPKSPTPCLFLSMYSASERRPIRGRALFDRFCTPIVCLQVSLGFADNHSGIDPPHLPHPRPSTHALQSPTPPPGGWGGDWRLLPSNLRA